LALKVPPSGFLSGFPMQCVLALELAILFLFKPAWSVAFFFHRSVVPTFALRTSQCYYFSSHLGHLGYVCLYVKKGMFFQDASTLSNVFTKISWAVFATAQD
jgi:hypothetical protein